LAVRAGLGTARLSRRLGAGEGSIIGGRVTLALHPAALTQLASGRQVVLVSGTNGKTTTSHLIAAALRTLGPVAHNASGSNMADGAVAALARDSDSHLAVIEVDELHLAAVAEAVTPSVIVLLNLSRDQLDRGNEVRSVAAALSAALIRSPLTTVVANADDPMVVWAAAPAARTIWVAAGSAWSSDTLTCPRCGHALDGTAQRWECACGLVQPSATWTAGDGGATHYTGTTTPVPLRLPGRFNLGNAVMAIAAAAELGVEPALAAAALGGIETIAGRYLTVDYGPHSVRLLLAKNPAGWAETLALLDQTEVLLIAVNAREADGRDTSWLWDVHFEDLRCPIVAACGEHAADLGVRLSYANITHTTTTDPLEALVGLPPGKVDLVGNYTVFLDLHRRLTAKQPAADAWPGKQQGVSQQRGKS
jgi:UDP-N-acetylmuramyl tripeptide synthase